VSKSKRFSARVANQCQLFDVLGGYLGNVLGDQMIKLRGRVAHGAQIGDIAAVEDLLGDAADRYYAGNHQSTIFVRYSGIW